MLQPGLKKKPLCDPLDAMVMNSNKRSEVCEWNRRKTDRRLIFSYTTLDYNSILNSYL